MTPPVSQLLSIISEAIERLRSCSQVNIQSNWRCWSVDIPITAVTASDWLHYPLAELNAKGHIAWSSGRQVLWLAQKFVFPDDLHGFGLDGLSLRLALTWWAEAAQIFVNGIEVQAGDLFDCSARVLICPSVTPGEEVTVALRLVSPGHDDGALVRSLCVYESIGDDRLDPGFVADELAVLERYLVCFEPEKLSVLAMAVGEIVWGEGGTNRRDAAVAEEEGRGFEGLRERILPLAGLVKECRFLLVGHAHLDLAWLWPVSETWDVAQRTFASVLELQEEFPLIFCHSTPALYAWIEEHCSELFRRIQQRVRAGCWEVVGGLWVEPELNLIDGESIVRQLLYGQRYVLEKFGNVSTVAWLPDSFGFCATLPQFLKQGGIEYFVTQKLRWNDTSEFPYGAFLWRSPDGSEVFSLMSAPIGEGIDPPKMASYACDWKKQTGLQDALWLPGVGDHGGGPTRDMLEVAKRWQQSPFFPRLEFTTVESYLQQISTHLIQETADRQETIPLPVWDDELYLEFHRGCYTSHADQKLWNRRCEGLLYQAELFASLATIGAGVAYPQAKLAAAWKQMLFNQFHDILPGSSIPQVYLDANSCWREVEQVGSEILEQSLSAIASQINLPTPPQLEARPIVVFNCLNWQRSEVVAVSLPASEQQWAIYSLDGHKLPCQLADTSMLFVASDIPSVGYRVFWLCPEQVSPLNPHSSIPPEDLVLENELLRVVVDHRNGNLCSVFDKNHCREILEDGGNQLQAFRDSGQYWDAWNIDPNYAQHPLPPTELKSIQWLERGSVQSRLRVVRQLGQSEFCQDYILQAGSPLLKIVTSVNWQERQVLVKAAFPLNFEADYATYEIPCGAIKRSTKPKTPTEQAKWEVPALRWADLSADGYGVSLLNDCKYGYDSQPNQLRLTLLRSPSWPDPEADKGSHEFTYALYPHGGSWQQAHTVRRGYELNLPLQVILCHPAHSRTNTQLSTVGQLLNLSAENLILMAFKQSEDNPHQWILRFYECHGEPAELSLQSDLELAIAQAVNLLEQAVELPELSPDRQSCKTTPWKVTSFTVQPREGFTFW